MEQMALQARLKDTEDVLVLQIIDKGEEGVRVIFLKEDGVLGVTDSFNIRIKMAPTKSRSQVVLPPRSIL